MHLLLVALFHALTLHAGHGTTTPGGMEVRWGSNNIPLMIDSHSSKSTTPEEIRDIILSSVNEWNSHSLTQINPVSSSVNGIQFLQDFRIYGSAVVGVTEVSYAQSGFIYKANIYLNEQNYVFNSIKKYQSAGSFYLGDVVTHELGHFLGLAHSEVLHSSMFYSTYPGQSTLSKDDIASIKNKYGGGLGKISGRIKGGNQIPVMGTHVQLVSSSSGEIISTISDEEGNFTLGGLELNETYYLHNSPVRMTDSLPNMYANAQTDFCPGSYTGSFFTPCGGIHAGIPQGIFLSWEKPTVDVGTVTINCALKTNEDYNFLKTIQFTTSMPALDYRQEPVTQKAIVGYFRGLDLDPNNFSAPDKFEINLNQYAGDGQFLKISVVSQSLGVPLEYQMNVESVSSNYGPYGKVPVSPQETFKTDLSITLPLSGDPEENLYQVTLQAKRLLAGNLARTIPDYQNFQNPNWYYLMIITVMEMTPEGLMPVQNNQLLTDNSSCLDAPFTYALARKEKAAEANGISRPEQQLAIAGCGTIDPPSDGGPGSSLPMMLLGFMLALLTGSLIKSSKKLLS